MPWALLMGLAQSIALIPGVSRSGITISAGMLTKLERQQAAVFAFLLSAPIVAGAGLKKLYDVAKERRDGLLLRRLRVLSRRLYPGRATGDLTIRFLLAFLRDHSLYPFVVYRVLVGAILLAVVC